MAILKKEFVWIEGYGKFEKVIKVSTGGVFSIEVPKANVKEGITQIIEVSAATLSDANKRFYEERRKFELLSYDFEIVLLYKIDERTDYSDGSGAGFVFNWGVFKKILKREQVFGVTYKGHYEFIRGFESVKEINIAWHGDWKKWKEVKHTEKIEDFFIKISGAIIGLQENLISFLAQDLQNVNEFKLLGTNDKGI